MTQSRRIAALLGLSACAQASSSSLRDSADAGGQPLTAPESLGEPLVDQLKLDGRAFSEVGEGSFFAYHEGWGYDVEVDADGLHVQHGEEALDIRFSRWGRESSLLEVEGFSPQFGPCTEDGELQSNGQCAQVLVFDHGAGVAEHIENTSAGPRQSWMIASPPSQGAGPLILELEVAGADLDTDEDVVYLTGEFGRSYQYHDLLAWDATGRVLPSFFEVQDGRILIVVDDAHAVYPIDVDPVLDNFADLSKSGSRSGQSFAWDVSSAGDLNGDGIVDLAVGVIWDDQVHIFYGGAGFDTTADLTFTAGGQFGREVDSIGDVNDDGYDDLIVGAYVSNSSQGRAYVFFGGSPMDTTADLTMAGGGGEQLGFAVAGIGDVNGDGVSDFAVGAAQSGKAYIHFGGTGVDATADLTLTGSGGFGEFVNGAGDVNGDGYDDVIVGARFAGSAYVFFGGASMNSTADVTLTPATSGGYFGSAVDSAGDVNADGYDDVIVGAPEYGVGFGNRGAASIFFGGSSMDGAVDLTLPGPAANSYAGTNLAGVRDVNGDGFDDVLVGAYGASKAFLYHGGTSMDTVADLTFTESANTMFGFALAGVGDINDDGGYDLVIGSPAESSNTGVMRVYFGTPDGDGDGLSEIDDCDDSDPAIGVPVSQYVDSDLDGFGSSAVATVCPATPGYSANSDDCDDTDDAVNGPATWYLDWDEDGHGDPDWDLESCLDLGSTGVFTDAAGADDCDDFDGATLGPTGFYLDNDGDTYGDESDVEYSCLSSIAGRVTNDDDCDDSLASVTVSDPWYRDADADTYGDATDVLYSCDAVAGRSMDHSDCNDGNVAVNPGATDICGDSVDQDCDGVGDAPSDDEDADGVIGSIEIEDGGDDCVVDDDGDGDYPEGRGDNDFDGVLDYLDATDDPYAVVNSNNSWTTSTAVTVYYSAPSGANQVCTTNTSTGACTWAALATTGRKSHTLTTTQGTKTVYTQFRNSASPSVIIFNTSDEIGLDTTKPVNGTATATAAPGEVTVAWSGFADLTSGLAPTNTYKVVYAKSATAPATCTTGTVATAGTTAETLTVTGLLNGSQYSFRVCAYDRAGNLSTGVTATETPGADQIAPTGTIVLNGGDAYGTASVTATLAATDDTAVTTVCLSTSTTCSAFTAYSTSKTVALSGSGLKTVYAYFKDANGNISSAASDSINVDPTRPTDGTLSGTGVSGGVDLTWTAATDAGSGLASYTLVYKAGSSAPATCAAGSSVTRVTGIASSDVARSVTGLAPSTTYGFRLCAVDAVGNVSIGRTISKTTPSAFMGPDGPESANDGALATAPMEGEELLSDTDAMGMDDASGPGAGCSSIGEASGRSGPRGLLAAFGALLGALGLRCRKA